MIKKTIILLSVLTILAACENKTGSGNFGNHKEKKPINTPPKKPHGKAKVDFNIYVENSFSMDGYLSNNSEFKNVLKNFGSDLYIYNNNKSPGLNFVNNKGTYAIDIDLLKFIDDLNPSNSKIDWPPGGDSSIDNIIDLCTQEMQNKVSIIFTDCILSYKGTGPSGAQTAQANVKTIMSRKIKEEKLSTLIIKFNSGFKGYYYNESRGGARIKLEESINRPFYALIFGEAETLKYLQKKIDFTKYKGYESSYTLLTATGNENFKSVITYKNKIGNFEFVKPASRMEIIKAEAKKGTTDFQFSISSNLSELPFQNDYLTNTSNYSVNENFKLISVDKINTNGFTHLFTLKTNNLKQTANLKIGLKYTIPDWIKTTGSDIDDNPLDTIQQRQTFGFQYLMSGIAESYIANNDSLQFKTLVKINKSGTRNGEESGFPWWILVLIIVIGIIIYLKNKK